MNKRVLAGALAAAVVPAWAFAAPMLGFSAPGADAERGAGGEVRRQPLARRDRRAAEAAGGGAQPGRLAARQGQRRVGARPVQELGLGRPHRDLPGALSDADGGIAGAGRPHAVQGQPRASRRSPATPPRPSKPAPCRPISSTARDGDVTADLVYVNYGMPDDYKALARLGVDVKGKIVIVRYGAGLARAEAQARRTSTARSAASSIPTPPTTATARATPIRRAPGGRTRACSAARSSTCRSAPAIR